MKLFTKEPTITRIEDLSELELSKLQANLAYIDKKVDYEIRRLKNAPGWLIAKNGAEWLVNEIERLKMERRKSLLFKDDLGYYTYSGVAPRLATLFNAPHQISINYPKPDVMPWAVVPEHKARPYQKEAIEKLLPAKHAAIELATGMGKTRILLDLVKSLALKIVVLTPTKSIAQQVFNLFKKHLGVKYVGFYGSGKKDAKKLVTIAIAASLARLQKGSEDWKLFEQIQVLSVDEAHLVAATTLERICLDLFKSVPYRFFVSGTQMRNDGLDLVLEGITGPIVMRMDVRKGVDDTYLAKPIFKMVRMSSDSGFKSMEPNDMTRNHLYYNKSVCKNAGELANRLAQSKRPTLILIDEIAQFQHILPHIRYEVGFAHGGLDASNKDYVPKQYHNSDPNTLVAAFNQGKLPILIGTSCIGMGTDLQVPEAVIYLMGGKSEIQVRQAVGRATRLAINPYTGKPKTDCLFIDYDIANIPVLHRHAMSRRDIYQDIYGPVDIVGA